MTTLLTTAVADNETGWGDELRADLTTIITLLDAAVAKLATVTTTVGADITTAVNVLTTGAPAGLNTFDEVAAAIGDDPAFSATMTTALNGKATKPTLAALVTFLAAASTSAARTAIGAGTSDLAIGTTGSTAKAGNWVPLAGDLPVATTVATGVVLRPMFSLTRTSSSNAWPGSRPSVPTGAMIHVVGPGDDPSWFADGQDLRTVTP